MNNDTFIIFNEDLREYLANYYKKNSSSKVSIDNIRRILSSFFSWLEDEDYIIKSPVRRIHKIKTAKRVKETYTDENLEIMRDNCVDIRDLARGKSKYRPRNAPELLNGPYPLVQTGDIANAGIYLKEYKQTYSELGLKHRKI